MILSFKDRGTRDIYDGKDTKAARGQCPRTVWPTARRKLDQVNAAGRLRDLRIPPNNKLHPLKDTDLHAIRINDQYRVVFRWVDAGAEEVTVTDYH